MASVDDDATAFIGRSAAHDIGFVASWLPEDPEPERHEAWARAAWEAMRPFAHGVYVNSCPTSRRHTSKSPTESPSTAG